MNSEYLSFQAKKQLLSALFDLVFSSDPNLQFFHDAGLRAHEVFSDFEKSCCEHECELAQLDVYRKIRARFLFEECGNPNDFEVMQQARPWGARYDEGEGARLLHEMQQRRKDVHFERRQEEYRLWRQANPLPDPLPDTFVQYFSNALVSCFSPLGFVEDGRRSSSKFPVVSKPLIEGWDICWSAESRSALHPKDWVQVSLPRDGNDRSWFALFMRCYITSQRGAKSLRVLSRLQKLPFMDIRIDNLSVNHGFTWSYFQMYSQEEADLCVYAYSKLYALYAEKLESALRLLLPQFL